MDFSFTSEQLMLRESLERYLSRNYSFSQRLDAIRNPAGWRPGVWKAFADELGILAAPFPESVGGLGGGPIETMVIMETLGSALVVEPFLESVVIAGSLLMRAGDDRSVSLLGEIMAGDAIVTLAHDEPYAAFGPGEVGLSAERRGDGWILKGTKVAVNAAPWATHLVATARTSGVRGDLRGISLFLIDKAAAKDLSIFEYATVDGSRAADLRFNGVGLPQEALLGEESRGLELLEPAFDGAAAAICAEATGIMRGMQDETLDYVRQRKQFGLPLGAFQVLQHRIVDMYMAIEQTVSATYAATLSLDLPDAERARAVSAAKVQAGKACRFVGQNAIQIHGGMGMTEELAISHRFKRATVIEQLFGGVPYHLSRFGRLAPADHTENEHA